jgi:tetratricopeptide (TPR) repeat protein
VGDHRERANVRTSAAVAARVLACAAACGSLGVLPASAIASPPSGPSSDDAARAQAKHHVERGAQLYDAGQYEEALAAFEDAASTYASPDFQFNIGLCHERLGHYDVAIRAYEVYLRNKPDAPDRSSVEHRIALLRQLADREGEEENQENDAIVVPRVEPDGGDPPADPPVIHPAPAVDRDRSSGAQPRTIAGGVLIAVGSSVAIAGGSAFGIIGQRRADRVDAVLEESNPEGLSYARTRALAQEADRYRAGAYASIATGVVLAVTGVALVITGQRRARAHAARPRWFATGRGFVVSGAF